LFVLRTRGLRKKTGWGERWAKGERKKCIQMDGRSRETIEEAIEKWMNLCKGQRGKGNTCEKKEGREETLGIGSCQYREDIAHTGLTQLLQYGKQLEDTKEDVEQQTTLESAKLSIS
uniref:Uncharacterized protein n=1 Tax=Apteryx owenii TaxID=8824 RepID=A0A8B9NUQ6_APTOW